MPQTVEVPDIGTVEFPDEMTPDQISAAIQKSFYSSSPAASQPEQTPEQFLSDLSGYKPPQQTQPVMATPVLSTGEVLSPTQSDQSQAVLRLNELSRLESTTPLENLWQAATGSLIPESVQKSLAPSNAVGGAVARNLASPVVAGILDATLGKEKTDQLSGGAARGVARLAAGLVSPLGIASAGIGELPALMQKAIALGFAGQIARQAPEQVAAIGESKDLAEATERSTELLGILGLAALGSKFALGRPAAGGIGIKPRPTYGVNDINAEAGVIVTPDGPVRPSGTGEPLVVQPETIEGKSLRVLHGDEITSPTPELSGESPSVAPEKSAQAPKTEGVAGSPKVSALEEKLQSILTRHKNEPDPIRQGEIFKEAQDIHAQLVEAEMSALDNEPMQLGGQIPNFEEVPLTQPGAEPIQANATPEIIQPESIRPQHEVGIEGGAPQESSPSNSVLGAAPSEAVAVAEATPSQAQPQVAPTAPAPNQVGIRNTITDQVAKAMDLPERVTPSTYGARAQLADAEAAIADNPSIGATLITELNQKVRPLTTLEDNVLTFELAARKNEFNKALKEFNSAEEGPAKNTAEVRLNNARADVGEAIKASRAGGTENARALEARKRLIDDQYELPVMQAEKEAMKGSPLTREEAASVEKVHAELEQKKAAVDKAEDAAANAEATAYFDQLIKTIKSEAKPAKASGKTITDFLTEQADAARSRIRGRRGNLSAGVDPTLLADYAIIGAEKIAKGVVKLSEFTKAMLDELGEAVRPIINDIFAKAKDIHREGVQLYAEANKAQQKTPEQIVSQIDPAKPLNHQQVYDLARAKVNEGIGTDGGSKGMAEVMQAVTKDIQQKIPEVTERQVRDAFSEYGKISTPSKEADLVKLREYRRLGQLVSAIEDAQRKQAPKKSGQQRDEPTPDIREKMKELEDAMKANGIETTSPEKQLKSTNAAREKSLTNQIEDLDRELQGIAAKREKGELVPATEKVERLRSIRDAMVEYRNRLRDEANPPAPEEQKALDRALVARERWDRILSGEEQPATKQPKEALTDLEADVRSEIEAMKEQARQMRRDALPKKDPNAAAEQAKIKALEKATAEYERRVREADISTRQGPKQGPPTERVSKAQSARDAARKAYDALVEASKPVRTPEEIRLDRFKKSIEKRKAALQERVNAGDYAKPVRKPLHLDAEAMRAQDEYLKVREKWERGLERDRLAKRQWWEKTGDAAAKWMRASVLSGFSTLAKLTSAGVERIGFNLAEEAPAGVLRHLPGLKQIAKKAPFEGRGLTLRQEGEAFARGLSRSMRDIKETLFTGKSELDRRFGKVDVAPRNWMDFFGALHGALKAPVKRITWERSFIKRMGHAAENGVDVTDPFAQVRIATDAYKDANRSIFMQDNRAVNAYKAFIATLEQPSKSTGVPSAGGKAAATAMKVLTPVVKIPTNIVAETLEYVLGSVSGFGKAARALRNGVENLHPDEADAILRHLKKGSVGGALLLLGYFNADKVGGYYTSHEKRKKTDVKQGGVRIFGHDIPKVLVHNPALEALQFGATIRRAADSFHKKSDAEPQGVPAGVMAAALGLAEEVPMVGEMYRLSELREPQGVKKFAGELGAAFVVPQLFQQTARALDTQNGEPVKRAPQTIPEYLKQGIPGLRETVPTKEDRKSPKEQAMDAYRESLPSYLKQRQIDEAMRRFGARWDLAHPKEVAKRRAENRKRGEQVPSH